MIVAALAIGGCGSSDAPKRPTQWTAVAHASHHFALVERTSCRLDAQRPLFEAPVS
jgi:hypothetical protein